MSKFLKIIRENSASLDNPNAVFYLKLVDDKGQEIGYEPIELRGTTYASDFFLKIKDMVGRGGNIGEEDNEYLAGAETLSDMGDKEATAVVKRVRGIVKAKKPIILPVVNKIGDALSKLQP
jgi:hypothetical protein